MITRRKSRKVLHEPWGP